MFKFNNEIENVNGNVIKEYIDLMLNEGLEGFDEKEMKIINKLFDDIILYNKLI